jgi:hypothetical protein
LSLRAAGKIALRSHTNFQCLLVQATRSVAQKLNRFVFSTKRPRVSMHKRALNTRGGTQGGLPELPSAFPQRRFEMMHLCFHLVRAGDGFFDDFQKKVAETFAHPANRGAQRDLAATQTFG